MSAPQGVAELAFVANTQVKLAVLNYVLALLLLFLFAIPLLCLALMVKLDSRGPVFFRQPRVGRHNEIFYIWKFRTMYVSCADIAGAQLTQRNDPRVTGVGWYLRKSSLDELPQLFNVLAGDMALVGPRPHPLQAKVGDQPYADVVRRYHERHAVLPGITGWAQVNGWRGETISVVQIEQRVQHDLEYIARQSCWFDLRILVLTVIRVWRNPAF